MMQSYQRRTWAAAALAAVVSWGVASSAVQATDCNQNGIDDSQELTCSLAFAVASNIAPPGIAIPDYNYTGISHTIQVAGAVDICRLRLHLHMVHQRVGQLVVKLRHDDGVNPATEITVIDLMGNYVPHGSSGECGAGLDLILSDEASTSIELSTHTECIDSLVFTGYYSPYPGLLAAFNGQTSAGDWTIKVYDVKYGSTGKLVSWGLDFHASGDNDCNDNLVPDECDISSGYSQDSNSNGIPDECESPDSDGDGFPDGIDNCPTVYNPGQADGDGDGVGDACDPCPNRKPGDVSGDGAVGMADVSPFVTVLLDPAGATADDRCAADVDGSGTPDGADIADFTALLLPPP